VRELVRDPQQPVAGVRDQLGQHIVELHGITSGIP
jgi:hypothetical protein